MKQGLLPLTSLDDGVDGLFVDLANVLDARHHGQLDPPSCWAMSDDGQLYQLIKLVFGSKASAELGDNRLDSIQDLKGID